MARALDGGGDGSLTLGATPDLAAAFNLAVLVQEPLERRDVLVVDNQRLAVADVTAAPTASPATTAFTVATLFSVSAIAAITTIASVSTVSTV